MIKTKNQRVRLRVKQRLNRVPLLPAASGAGEEVKSGYRAYSRMHCSFVFPENSSDHITVKSANRPLEDYETEDFIDHGEAELDQSESEKKENERKY